MIQALAFAYAMGRSVPLVGLVASEAQRYGIPEALAVALVEHESRFNPSAERRNTDGSTDWGLMQLNSRWHPQLRHDIPGHVGYGMRFFAGLIQEEGGDIMAALARYNSGSDRFATGRRFAEMVLSLYRKIRG